MVDESLDCLSYSQYSDRAWSLDAFVQYAHLRVISAEFGVILLSDCCMVSLNLFVCGKCHLVAVSVGEHIFRFCGNDSLISWVVSSYEPVNERFVDG